MVTAKKSSGSDSGSKRMGSKKVDKLEEQEAEATEGVERSVPPPPAEVNAKTAISPNVPWPFPASSS